ncbi:MAG: GHMP kinase, partial [bacterium]
DLRLLNQAKEGQVRAALDLVIRGIKEQNGQLLAKGSTLSALAHQSILSKPNLEEILAEVLKLGAWGINIAHSGTVIGVLFDPAFLDDYSWYARIEKALGRSALAACRLIDGGRKKDAD